MSKRDVQSWRRTGNGEGRGRPVVPYRENPVRTVQSRELALYRNRVLSSDSGGQYR